MGSRKRGGEGTHGVEAPGVFELVFTPVGGDLGGGGSGDILFKDGGDGRGVEEGAVEVYCEDFYDAHCVWGWSE